MTEANNDPNTGAPVVPGPRGGSLRPWQPGQSGNPAGMSAAKREAHRMARLASPGAVAVLTESMMDPAEDARVRIVAAGAVLDRGLGRAKEPPPEESESDQIDLAHLTREEREELKAALATIYRLTGRGLAPLSQVQIYLPDNGRGDSGVSDAEMAAAAEAVERMTRPPEEITTIRRIIVDPRTLSDEELDARIAEGERELARQRGTYPSR
jgi:hypothetical protein